VNRKRSFGKSADGAQIRLRQPVTAADSDSPWESLCQQGIRDARPGEAPSAALAFSGETPTTHIENLQRFKLGSRTASGPAAPSATSSPCPSRISPRAASTTARRWRPGTQEKLSPPAWHPALFAAVSHLQYSGSIEVVAQECNAAARRAGAALNISGSAWSGMQAPVHQVCHEIMRTRLDFGPSPMWGAADLLELFRATRPQKPDANTLAPEEKPKPIQYRANSVNRASQPGGSDPEEQGKGTVDVRIFHPTGDPGFDKSLVGWTISGTNGSGNGPATFALPNGDYSIVRFFPLGYVSSVETSPSSSFTVVEDAIVNTDIGVTEAKRLRLLRRVKWGCSWD